LAESPTSTFPFGWNETIDGMSRRLLVGEGDGAVIANAGDDGVGTFRDRFRRQGPCSRGIVGHPG